jgi:hypothetical protein
MLLQGTTAGTWWNSSWLWIIVVLLVISGVSLLRQTWQSPRRR